MPAQGSTPACLCGIDDVEASCRAARSLGDEYLFERFPHPIGVMGPLGVLHRERLRPFALVHGSDASRSGGDPSPS